MTNMLTAEHHAASPRHTESSSSTDISQLHPLKGALREPSAPSNPRFLAGLAELLGQFGPMELEGHRPGLVGLVNDVIWERQVSYGPLDSETPTIVIQRVAGELAA